MSNVVDDFTPAKMVCSVSAAETVVGTVGFDTGAWVGGVAAIELPFASLEPTPTPVEEVTFSLCARIVSSCACWMAITN